MRIDIAKELLEGETKLTVTRMFSADTTVSEVCRDVIPIWLAPFGLWDCTFNPPKDITDWPTKEFPDLQGPKSKTLHDAGCFPSGHWLVLPRGLHPNEHTKTDYEDCQYNQQPTQPHVQPSTNSHSVKFNDPALASSTLLPSEVFASVTERFAKDEDDKGDIEQAQLLRRRNKEVRRQILQERAEKLDHRIQLLEEGSSEKNKAVSDQVRKMLVKSRATGNPNLKMQDRLYFQCLLDHQGKLTREYRYFSPQDTFAKIPVSFPKLDAATNVEVVVRRISDTGPIYRRLPVTMRVYEAISNKILTDQVDTLVIRWSQDGEDPTPSILDEEIEEAPVDQEVEMKESQILAIVEDNDEPPTEEVTGLIKDNDLLEAIQIMDEANNKGKKQKKKSAASLKVRNMQIKSKAKGDAKRVPMENRFFLEVVIVNNDGKASSSFVFVSKTDPIYRILQSLASAAAASDWDFLVHTEGDSCFTRIEDTSLILQEANERQVLKSFDRIVIRPAR
jgi:hypothetical protein